MRSAKSLSGHSNQIIDSMNGTDEWFISFAELYANMRAGHHSGVPMRAGHHSGVAMNFH